MSLNKFETNPEGVEMNYLPFLQYKKLVDHYIKVDARELNFQNRIILLLLETILIHTDIEVVDSSTLYNRGKRNSQTLKTSEFKADNCAPPDLLLTKNWNLDNLNNKVTYLCAMEIKSPNSKERIFSKPMDKYPLHIKKQLKGHLTVHNKLILTDCYRWQFIKKKADLPLSIETIDLVESDGQWKVELDASLAEDLREYNQGHSSIDNEWYKLQNKILEFLK